MEQSIDILLLAFMVVVALAMIRLRNLFAVAMLASIFSLLSAAMFVVLDAVDVAFTEAAVGAGISTVLMLGTLALTFRQERHPNPKKRWHADWLALLVVCVTGAALFYGSLDMPHFGDANAPIHHHVAPRYIEDSVKEVGPPNMVTSVLASYRGYDTLGETTVIFTAGMVVMVLLAGLTRRRDPDAKDPTGREDRS